MACSVDPFLQLAEEAHVSHVPRVDFSSITPLEFYRRYVAQSQPVILTHACDQWPAVQRWTNDYLRNVIGHLEVSVNVTPDGHGDAVIEGRFVKPEERQMLFSRYIDILEGKEQCAGVFYISHQNGSFDSEFGPLHSDIDQNLESFGKEVFGLDADAVNLWLGDDWAVSSMHKDHYENLYAVVRGEKHFTLMPPWEGPFTCINAYPPARYQHGSDEAFHIVDEEGPPVPWMAVDPDAPDLKQFPLFANAKPLHVVVKTGEVLYLPALWYHKVKQRGDTEGKTMAVNYWFDMEYGPLYHYYQFLRTMADQALTSVSTS